MRIKRDRTTRYDDWRSIALGSFELLGKAFTRIEQLEQTLKRTQGHDEQVGDLADNLPVLSDGAACYVTLTPHLSSVYEPSITVAQLDGCAVDLYRYVDGEPVFMLSLSGAEMEQLLHAYQGHIRSY